MFNRSRSTGTPQSTASLTLDSVLAELEASAPEAEAETPAPAEPEAAAPVVEETKPVLPAPTKESVDEHAETLRATRVAQVQAQEMLALAAQERTAASEQAEQIVLEARDVADRLRADAEAEAERTRVEAVDWVRSQRTRVEEATSTLTREAERDAEGIRAEAMRAAMVEAEQTARLYVGEAAARGARDAEEIRAAAREVLHRAADLGADLQGSLSDVAAALQVAMASVRDQLAAIDTLLEDTRRDLSAPSAETRRAAEVAAEDESLADTEDDAETVVEDAEKDAVRDAADDADAATADEGAADEGDESRTGRQLGSLFREGTGA